VRGDGSAVYPQLFFTDQEENGFIFVNLSAMPNVI